MTQNFNNLQRRGTTAQYRRVALAVPVKPANEFEVWGTRLLVGAMLLFAAGAIARLS